MYQELQIQDMQKEDIDQAVELWVKQYRLYCNREEFPKYWITNTAEIKYILENQIQDYTAAVAKQGAKIVGFLFFFMFDFHNENLHYVRIATLDDLQEMQPLVDESVLYYKMEPLFLKREAVSTEKLRELIKRDNIFVACDGDKIIGFMNINRAAENDLENLSVINCGLINELGAYIKPEYRGNKVGTYLLNAIARYCRNNSIDLIHVDFETANPFANQFWRKYFTPMISSVRRTINKDASTAVEKTAVNIS